MTSRRNVTGEAAVARLPNHLDVVWAERDGSIWTTWWDTAARWERGFPLSGPHQAQLDGHVAVEARTANQLDVFWVGTDGAVWSVWWGFGAGRWSAPFQITPPNAARPGSRVVAVSRFSDHLDVFWVGADNAVWTTWWDTFTNPAGWAVPFPITQPGAAHPGACLAAISRMSDHLDVFFVGADGAVWTVWWNGTVNNGRWNAPFAISPAHAARPTSQIAAVARHDNQIDLFWVGPDGGIWSAWWNWFANSHAWNPVFRLTEPGAAAAQAGVAAVARFSNHLDIFWVGSNGAIWTMWWDVQTNNAAWQTPFMISPPGHARDRSQLSVVSRIDSRLDLFWRGNDGATWTTWWEQDANWGSPFRISTFETVRLHFKTLAAPQVPVQAMLEAMREVYEPNGLRVEVITEESLDLPVLADVDVGGCFLGAATEEQVQLFQHRNHVGPNDVVVYFVRSTVPPFNGCAAHPQGQPGAVVASGATRWTLGHEVGHVLGLSHVDDNNRLMTGNGTLNITNPPPDLIGDEITTMRESNLSV